MIIHIII